MERRVLGKGLEALIPKKSKEDVPQEEFMHLNMLCIHPGKYQPRQEVDPQELKELAQSLKDKGFIQPIVVRKKAPGDYEIVAGGRRYAAAKSLGLKEIPAIIKELDDRDAFVYAIVENLQRKNLNPIEEAEAFKRLMEEFSFSLEDVAQFVAKDKTTVVNSLRLKKLPENIQEALRQGTITRSQARTILALEDLQAQEQLFQQVLGQKMSVREIEHAVRRHNKAKPKVRDPFAEEVEDKLQKRLGTKVRIYNKRDNKGKIVIEYYNLADLERIIRRFG